MYQRIVVPLDGSPLAEAVLPYAIALAEALGSEIHLLRVVPQTTELVNLGLVDVAALGSVAVPDMQALTEAVEAQMEQASRYLQTKARELQQHDLKTRSAVLRGDPATQVIHYAQEQEADLIAISTHGRSGISRMVFGSVADKVVRQVNIPVLLIHPKEDSA